MRANLLASLEAVIDDWICKHGEAGELPPVYLADTLAEDMARACAAVFDAAQRSQEYAKAQENAPAA